MIRRYLGPALLFTFVTLLAVPALAQVQPIEGCTIIDKPGSYVLGKDITATMADLKRIAPDRPPGCIIIVADFVTLDLQGHTIAVGGSQDWLDSVGIYITNDASGRGTSADRVRNGCVTGFGQGISLDGPGHVIEQLRITGNIVGIAERGDGIKIRDVTAVSNSLYGILCFRNSGLTIENCQVSNNWAGIFQLSDEYGSPIGTRIVGNNVSGNTLYGIYAQCPSLILQNMSYNNGCSGGRGCHDIVVKGFGCNMSTDNVPIQANPDYPGVP